MDAVVSQSMARTLGFPRDNALLINAPEADSTQIRDALRKALPRGTQVVVLKPTFTSSRRQPVPTSRISVALAAAAGKLGAPYVWGAEGPDAFDCSGFIQWAFGQAGVRLPRVTHRQFASGPKVPFSQMRPGDLIFWRLDPTNPGYISHAAIYWGDGKMIQAPRTGDVVKIVPVHTRNLAGVVRVRS
ncbi:C40 family peptidase [Nonomuraea sp. CA-141351]|uniref:C40 family peptidase n=1 Tax=Nonomuraea sp. CA-141351 TaxID=3239996 RepID=UPI003D8CA6E9